MTLPQKEKSLSEFMRESFGTEEKVFHFYIIGQEQASLEGVKKWLLQKKQELNDELYEDEDLPEHSGYLLNRREQIDILLAELEV